MRQTDSKLSRAGLCSRESLSRDTLHHGKEGRLNQLPDSTTTDSNPIQYPALLNTEGGTMASLTNALQQLRAEQREARLHVEKLGQAISVIESLNGSGTSRNGNQPKRFISAASRRKMALAQKARWAKIRKGSQPTSGATKTTGSTHVKRTISAAGRKRIAVAQRARWAKVKAAQRKAA